MRVMRAHPETDRALVTYELDALSDEERALIQLYALAHLGMEPGRVLFIDAPHVALPPAALRRWLDLLLARAETTATQALVVVEDPDLVRDLPAGAVKRFERPGAGPPTVSTP